MASTTPLELSRRVSIIRKKIVTSLTPSYLDIIDESAAHLGHVGAQSGAGHFAIIIDSPKFKDKTLIEKHRLVYDALRDMMDTDIHALRIEVKHHEEDDAPDN